MKRLTEDDVTQKTIEDNILDNIKLNEILIGRYQTYRKNYADWEFTLIVNKLQEVLMMQKSFFKD